MSKTKTTSSYEISRIKFSKLK